MTGWRFLGRLAIAYSATVLLVVLAISPYFSAGWDPQIFAGAGRAIIDNSATFDLYQVSRQVWGDWGFPYPPLYAHLLAPLIALTYLVPALPDWIAVRMLPVLFDVTLAVLLYQLILGRSRDETLARLGAVLWLFNPLTLYQTAIQAHQESSWLVCVVAAYALISRSSSAGGSERSPGAVTAIRSRAGTVAGPGHDARGTVSAGEGEGGAPGHHAREGTVAGPGHHARATVSAGEGERGAPGHDAAKGMVAGPGHDARAPVIASEGKRGAGGHDSGKGMVAGPGHDARATISAGEGEGGAPGHDARATVTAGEGEGGAPGHHAREGTVAGPGHHARDKVSAGEGEGGAGGYAARATLGARLGEWAVLPSLLMACAVTLKQSAILLYIPYGMMLLLQNRQRLPRLLVAGGLFALVFGGLSLPYYLHSPDFFYLVYTDVANMPVQTQSAVVWLLGLSRYLIDQTRSTLFLLRDEAAITITLAAILSFFSLRRDKDLFRAGLLTVLLFFLTSKKVMGYHYVILTPFLLIEALPTRRFDLAGTGLIAASWIIVSPYFAPWAKPEHLPLYAAIGTPNTLLWLWLFVHIWRRRSELRLGSVSVTERLADGSAVVVALLLLTVGMIASSLAQPWVGNVPAVQIALLIAVVVVSLAAAVAVARRIWDRRARLLPAHVILGSLLIPVYFAAFALTEESTLIIEGLLR